MTIFRSKYYSFHCFVPKGFDTLKLSDEWKASLSCSYICGGVKNYDATQEGQALAFSGFVAFDLPKALKSYKGAFSKFMVYPSDASGFKNYIGFKHFFEDGARPCQLLPRLSLRKRKAIELESDLDKLLEMIDDGNYLQSDFAAFDEYMDDCLLVGASSNSVVCASEDIPSL